MRAIVFLFLFGNPPTDADIVELGNSSFSVRQATFVRLENMGSRAIPRLEQELHHPDIEVRRRCSLIVYNYYNFLSPLPAICALPEDLREMFMESYVLAAHKTCKGKTDDAYYMQSVLPFTATEMLFRDMLYWGTTPESVEKLRSVMISKSTVMYKNYYGRIKTPHPCQAVAEIMKAK